MRNLVIAIALMGYSGPALGQTFTCSGAAVSPYPALVASDHDHRRVAPGPSILTRLYPSFFAAFDNEDDDDGDGAAEAVGDELHDHLIRITGSSPFDRGELALAEIRARSVSGVVMPRSHWLPCRPPSRVLRSSPK